MLDLVLLCCWSVGLGQGQELPVQTLCLQLLKRLTVERFVRCHQGKLRQQKHTHSGKKVRSGVLFPLLDVFLGFQWEIILPLEEETHAALHKHLRITQSGSYRAVDLCCALWKSS